MCRCSIYSSLARARFATSCPAEASLATFSLATSRLAISSHATASLDTVQIAIYLGLVQLQFQSIQWLGKSIGTNLQSF